MIVDGTSLGAIPSESVARGPTGEKAVATATGEGVGIVPPAVSGSAVTIPWGDETEPREDTPIQLTLAAVPLSYRIDRPEEVVRVDGYFDGVPIRDLENGLAVIPAPGRHSFTVAAYGADGSVLRVDRADFLLLHYGNIDIDGGLIEVDESGGITCSASARTYTPGERYWVVVGCDYRDTAEVFLQMAEFRVDGPGGWKEGVRDLRCR